VRGVSLQEPSDLRIRRRKHVPEAIDVISLYLEVVKSKLKTIRQARQYLINQTATTQLALHGDIRSAYTLLLASNVARSDFDAAITSPPYATGLPYVDTDRLSLVLLGLIDADQIHDTQRALIGNREITNSERKEYMSYIDENTDHLPIQCIKLCRELKGSVSPKDGFRRQNVPAVIYHYFADIAVGFSEVRKLLKRDAPFALVVGKNSTTLGGKQFTIETPQLLADIAESRGFKLEDLIKLDTYQRFDIHKANSIRSEHLVILRAR
jgi:site-specific DNA-methyltransferase (cytosine-N4-specific)